MDAQASGFILMQPGPGMELAQVAQVVVFFATSGVLVWYVLRLVLTFFIWPGGPSRKSSDRSTGLIFYSENFSRRRLLIGPMFVDGEIRWIRWSN